MLLLPLSARKNIVSWLESYRDRGLSIKQSAISFFDAGNSYTSIAKKKDFNKKVEWIVSSLENAGITVKKTPKGRYSITSKMLSKITPEDLDSEFKKWAFSDDSIGIDFADKNITPTLQKLYDSGHLDEFNDVKIFQAFAKNGNIPALRWLVKTFGVDNYPYTNKKIEETLIIEFTSDDFKVHEDILDFYIESGIINGKRDGNKNYPPLWQLARSKNENVVKKILPFVNIPADTNINLIISEINKMLPKFENVLNKYLNFNENDWKVIVDGLMTLDDRVDFESQLADFFICLMHYPEFKKLILEKKDFVYYENILNTLPEVREIFIF